MSVSQRVDRFQEHAVFVENRAPGDVFEGVVAFLVANCPNFVNLGIIEAPDRQVRLIDEKCIGKGYELRSGGREDFEQVGFVIQAKAGDGGSSNLSDKFAG